MKEYKEQYGQFKEQWADVTSSMNQERVPNSTKFVHGTHGNFFFLYFNEEQ